MWRVEFFKIGKHDFKFIREMRVDELKSRTFGFLLAFHCTTARQCDGNFQPSAEISTNDSTT